MEAEFARIGHGLQSLDSVLRQSGAIYNTENVIDQECGLGAEPTLYLTERGVNWSVADQSRSDFLPD